MVLSVLRREFIAWLVRPGRRLGGRPRCAGRGGVLAAGSPAGAAPRSRAAQASDAAAGGFGRATDHVPDTWQRRGAEIARSGSPICGRLPRVGRPRPPWITLSEEPVGDVLREICVRYEVEPGCFTEAYLLKPAHPGPKQPAVAVFHSTVAYSIHQPAGVEGPPETAFGLKLGRQGYVTLCPRNFLWPDNEHIEAENELCRFQERHPGSQGMAKMLWDAQVAIDILAGMPEVDSQRLEPWGYVRAKEVLYLAAFDERIPRRSAARAGSARDSRMGAPWYFGAR